eukprot:CAMPEP_0204220776 /NCGR_PEP_ID=MMETSP0361-20130328/81174_1 /ASSEMBLY_ACC=CAM_ASM_000343 /TAXON_ID=268821 /ORGANISM="Scrippsiella Hangoei, Strain SHTV-5" /LENGTH=105 /DNA_ID=CAMNT_0051186203 /DNA_START=268 /DNA_END=585 /DNA_ORIENTATION=+
MPPAQSHSLNGLSMREPTSILQKLSNPNVYPSQDPTIAGTNGPQDDTAPNCPKTKETVTELNVVAAINLPMKKSLGGQEFAATLTTDDRCSSIATQVLDAGTTAE